MRVVERFLKLKATKKWGLGNQKVGFGQPKSGVWATKKWGLNFRKIF